MLDSQAKEMMDQRKAARAARNAKLDAQVFLCESGFGIEFLSWCSDCWTEGSDWQTGDRTGGFRTGLLNEDTWIMGMLNITVAPDMSYQCRCNVCSLMKMLQSVFQGSGGVANANVAARREINAKIRLNKILLRCKLDKILMASDIGLDESKSICEKS